MSTQRQNLRIHTTITPEPEPTQEKRIRWKSLPHPLQKRRRKPKEPLTLGDRLLRNSAYACALLLAILSLGNIQQPWAERTSAAVSRALTMRIDLDESIGQLHFVQEWMPESALVFFNLSGETELAAPVQGELRHPYSETQPWLLFSCPAGSPVCAVSEGTVTAVSELSGGAMGLLVDHGEGLESVYAYLDEVSVQSGDAVARGQALGTSTAQLYFELREAEETVDPTERMGL